MADPLTIRYNNPGALEYKDWMSKYGGRLGPNGRYAAFDSPDQGYGVMSKVLDTYGQKHGLTSVSGIVNRWAPPNVDNNSTGDYIKRVSSSLGIDPNAPVPPERRADLMRAMATVEAGRAPAGLSAAQPPMMLGGPKDAPTGAQPMALYDPQQQQQGFSLENLMTSPLFQMGAGVLGAPNIGQGLMQGSQAASQFATARQKQQREAELFPLQKQLMQAQITKAGEPPSSDDIREFQFAKKDGYAGGFADWMKQKREMNGQTAQQVTWGTDAQGNYVAMQASRDGKLVQSQLPQGVVPVPAEVLAYRKTQANQQGEASGKARANLPVVETNAKLMKDALDAVENDPYLPTMTGFAANYRPNISKEAVASQARIDQVQGKAFLQAFEGLRGGGAITEAEGAKATASISRLQAMAVGTEEYKRALNDVRKEIDALVSLARQKASSPEPSYTVRPPGQQGQPQGQPQQPVDLGNGIKIRRLD